MVHECQSSGQTVEQWCSENEINVKTYCYRLKRVRDRICEKISEKQDIVPLAICMGNRKSASENVLIIIRINGAEIAVQSGTDAETLRSILSVMKSI
jgi:putative transposase